MFLYDYDIDYDMVIWYEKTIVFQIDSFTLILLFIIKH